MNWLKTLLKWRWIRALMIWNHVPIRAQGGILALIPLVALVISFIFAVYGNNQRGWTEYDIQRRFKLVRQYNDLMMLMINAETGERGFLLTKRREFLAPYDEAVKQIPEKIASLEQTLTEEPGEKQRLERLENLALIRSLIERQLDSLKTTQEYRLNGDRAEALYEHLQNGKSLMDEIRLKLGEMEKRDGELLGERVEEINWIRKRDYLLLFVVLLLGVLMRLISFYLFDRGIVRRVDRLRENVESLNKGEKIKVVPPKKDDAIGLLEQEIAKIAERHNLSI